MLLGTHSPKLDDKGRVILPAKFREDLAGGVVITRGQERCLYVFSNAEFESVHERIRQAPLSNKQARDFLRMFLSGASAEMPDSPYAAEYLAFIADSKRGLGSEARRHATAVAPAAPADA